MSSLNTGDPFPSFSNAPVHVSPRESSVKGKLADLGYRFLLSVLLLGLFGEWMYPLRPFMDGDQGNVIELFLALTGMLLLAGCFRLPSYLYAPIPPVLIAGSLYLLYGNHEGFSWFADYISQIAADVTEIVQTGRLFGISGETRALLLLIGWSLLVVSVQMLAMGKQSILLFIAASLLYLLALEAVGEIPVFQGLVRAAGLGLALQILVFRRHLRLHMTGKPGSIFMVVPIAAGCVLGALLLSSLLPIQPVRHIAWNKVMDAFAEWTGSEPSRPAEGYSLSGYGNDDSRLGGALRLFHETYFMAVSPQATYWRGESKNVYTGRGWIASSHEEDGTTLNAEPDATDLPGTEGGNQTGANGDSETVLIKQTVMFKKPASGTVPLFSGGTPVEVERVFYGSPDADSVSEGAGDNTHYDPDRDALYLKQGRSGEQIYGYVLTASIPAFSADRLRSVQGTDPEDVTSRNLELPGQLPERVRDLGISLTEGAETRYDAVMAVMNHLKNSYAYRLDAKYPPAGSDFADDFLFVQKAGYCDHFSTAMTVLLRSAGIPARWVKGFAPGTPDSEDGHRYKISYADAHAWVEVYFPGAGWIPFDPTPGFEAVFTSEIEGEAVPEEADDGGSGYRERFEKSAAAFLGAIKERAAEGWRWIQVKLFLGTSIVLAIGLLACFAVIYRKKWFGQSLYLLWLYWLRHVRKFPGHSDLLRAADRVWMELYAAYGKKGSGLTAREYVSLIPAHKRLDGHDQQSLEHFVDVWEKLYYGGAGMDRTGSKHFLRLCQNLAFGGR